MINTDAEHLSRDPEADRWRARRIWVAGAFGAMLAGSGVILDFWPVGASGSFANGLRGFLDISRLIVALPLMGFTLGLLIAALIALWRLHFRRLASNILAIAAIPVCFGLVGLLPLFDPWLWYAMVNNSRFEALAASASPSNEPKYAVVEGRDVSVGFVGGSTHFVFLIFDESDAVGLEPSERPDIWRTRTIALERSNPPPIPRGRRLYGHVFRVDEFL